MDGTDRSTKASLEAHRKARLRAFIDQHVAAGGAAAVARLAGRTQANISHLALPEYSFGPRAARGLEARLRLSAGYFDAPFDAEPSADFTVAFAPTWAGGAPPVDGPALKLPVDWVSDRNTVAVPVRDPSDSIAIVAWQESVKIGDAVVFRSPGQEAPAAARLAHRSMRLVLDPLSNTGSPSVPVAEGLEILGPIVGLWTTFPRS